MTPSLAPSDPAPAPIPDSRWSPLELLHVARKRWVLLVATSLAVVLAATFYTLGQTKIYEASATILFDPNPPRPLGKDVDTVVDLGGGNSYFGNREYYRTQHWIIQSMPIALAVARRLGLHKQPYFVSNAARTASESQEEQMERAARRILARLSVNQVKDSRLASITYGDADPVRAQRVVSAIVDTYVSLNLDSVQKSTNSAADWLSTQASTLKADLEKSEMALFDFKNKNQILSVSLDDQSNMLREEMRQLNAALTEVRAQREAARARQVELNKVTTEDLTNLPVSELLSNPRLSALRADLVAANMEVEGLGGSGKGDAHPEMRAAVARGETTKAAVLAEIQNIKKAATSEFSSLTAQVNGLNGLFTEARDRALALSLLEIEYNRLRRTKDNNEKLFSVLTDRSKETDLTRMLRVNNVQIVERPSLPTVPSEPNVPGNIGGGILLGLLLGFGAAIGREQLDRSIKSPEDAERELGLSFLGLLPALHSSTAQGASYVRRKHRKHETFDGPQELIVHERPSSGVAEAARSIRTNVLFMSPDNPYRTLLVTSAGPSEGKTTVACFIAIAMAQAGKRVVLVDCDMRRPRLHRVFGISRENGITAALLDPSRQPTLAQETKVPNLKVVTTGALPPNPVEILHSDAFARMLDYLKMHFDCVIIDSPPIVPITDAAVLSTAVDGTILVLRAFQTSKDLARRAVRALRDVSGTVVGTVLNAVDFERHAYGSPYQYYYYRKEGYAAEETVTPSDRAG